MYGERIGSYTVLVDRPERKEPLGKPRCRWEVSINFER
jgi:hypothetical protein